MDAATKLRRKNEFDGSLAMGVKKFMARTGRDEHTKRRYEFFVDPVTGLLRADMGRPRACPLCGGSDRDTVFVKDGFSHVRCQTCLLMHVSPVAKDEVVEEFYRSEASWTEVLENPVQLEFDRLKFHYGLDIALEHCPRPRRILDVGCGPGIFLDVARERGYDAVGVELNQKNVADMRARGIEVHDRLLQEVGFDDASFDIVALWEVLEHIVEPKPLLDEVRRITKPGGVVLILVPNAAALVTRLLHERSNTFAGYSHVNFFDIGSLTEMALLSRLEVLAAETIITELGAIANHLSFQDPYTGRADPAVFEWLTPEFIHEKLLGSKLLAVLRPTDGNKES